MKVLSQWEQRKIHLIWIWYHLRKFLGVPTAMPDLKKK